MKKFLLSLSFITQIALAQTPITFLTTDVPVAGNTQKIITDSLPLPAVNYGNKGANQFYDFSNLVQYKDDTIEYRTPTANQLSVAPGSTVATTLDGLNFLLTKTTANNMTLEGFEGQLFGNTLSANYSTKPEVYQFPMTYGKTFSGTAALTKTVPGIQVGQPNVSQVRLTINTTYTDTVDGWGAVKTPIGIYKCLRNKRKETTTTLIEAQIFPPFWSTISNNTATTVRYTYLAKETKGSVVTFDYDSLDNLRSVTYSQIPPSAPVADFSFTTPSGGLASFTDLSDNYPTSWSWNFGDGSTVSTLQNPNHTYTANNTYNVCLTATNAGGSNQVCKNVVISGITAANNAPVAFDDTASTLSATMVVVNVLANDLDPDGDSICISSVWGTPSAVINSTSPCSSVSYLPDTCFIGVQTFYYSICDNGSPSKCDTGQVDVTVTANANYYAVAFFDKSNMQYSCNTLTIPNGSQNNLMNIWTVREFAQPNDSMVINSVNLSYVDFTAGQFFGSVCLEVSNQCTTDKFCDTIQVFCEGINNIELSGISIYPNPSINAVTIDMKNSSDDIASNYSFVEVENSLGQNVLAVSNIGTNTKLVQLDVSQLPSGFYYAIIKAGNGDRRTLGRFAVAR